MVWNWQCETWPQFKWEPRNIRDLESRFSQQMGVFAGSCKHLRGDDHKALIVELISSETIKTSAIEGEILNRDSVQSSIRRHFGVATDNRRVSPAEHGMSEMMVDVHATFAEPLTHDKLFDWHRMLTTGRRDLIDIGCYRTHEDAMQIVSGRSHAPNVHFEAPPSDRVIAEMDQFIQWYNDTAPDGYKPYSPLTRAAIVHLYFVSIHPFEDGNGRIGRALSIKALSQCADRAILLPLSNEIELDKKEYYQQLESNSHDLVIHTWLRYFGETVMDAQNEAIRMVDFLIAKTQLFDRMRGRINARQEKALRRMFREGLEGFKGGLSADNYIKITGTSRATATRDLHDLVDKGALTRTGERRYARYWLVIS